MIGKKNAVYCRVSTEAQDDNFSVREQKDRGSKWAEEQDIPYSIYEDVFTGKTLDRPQMSNLIADIKSDQIDSIWIIEFTRLSRDLQDSYTFRDIAEEHNVKIFINGEQTEIKTPEQFLNFGINSVIADYERRRIVERNERGKRRRRLEGGKWHSNPPYGYEAFYNDKGKREIRIKEDEMQYVLYIFDQVVNHNRPFKALCSEFNDRMIPPRKGDRWWESNFSRIVRNSLYAGFYVFENEEITSYVYPKVIDRDLWDRAQAETKSRNLKYTIRYNYNKCSSLLHCYYCGSNITFHNKKLPSGNYIPQYKINHKKDCQRIDPLQAQNFRPKEMLDKWFEIQFLWFATDGESLYNYYLSEQERNKNIEESKKLDIARLEQDQKKVKTKKSKLIKLLLDIEDDNDLKNELKELSEQDKLLEAKIHELKTELTISADKLAIILSSISHDLRQEYFSYRNESFKQRKLLEKFLKDGYIKDQEIVITWITGKTVVSNFEEVRNNYILNQSVMESIFADDPDEIKKLKNYIEGNIKTSITEIADKKEKSKK